MCIRNEDEEFFFPSRLSPQQQPTLKRPFGGKPRFRERYPLTIPQDFLREAIESLAQDTGAFLETLYHCRGYYRCHDNNYTDTQEVDFFRCGGSDVPPKRHNPNGNISNHLGRSVFLTTVLQDHHQVSQQLENPY
jgi:hypothetical protein